MAEAKGMTREERLAMRLRDNLRRRKAQARALAGSGPDAGEPTGESGAPLSKLDPNG